MTLRASIRCLLLATAGLLIASSAAVSQNFPSKAMTFVYPYAAGSNADTAWRTIDQEVGRQLGVPLVHENRPGAGGRLGLEAMLRSAPDGSMTGMISNGLAINQPIMDPKMMIRPGKDYTPVMCCIATPLVIVVRSNAPFKDLKSLIAYAKANPGKVTGSSSGVGAATHLGLALLNSLAGINIIHVPYNGVAAALTALVSGEVDVAIQDAAIKPYLDDGKFIALAVGDDQRWSVFPKIPTAAEAGLPGFKTLVWHGVAAPPGLPADMRKKLSQAFIAALSTPEVKVKVEAAGFVVRPDSAEAFTDLIIAETELMRPVIEAAKIKFE